MEINTYLNQLPDEVLLDAEFCVTLVGNKQPYDPIKKRLVSAKDQFYSLEELLTLVDDLESYETLGIKASKGISIIDIDGCIDSSGGINETAIEIINYMKSYTEISPSGTGIRILFKAANPFNIEDYKTKNSKIGLEYYDADDQETRGGRMARLTGNKIMPYPFREVNTEKLLNKYMVREKRSQADVFEGEINSEAVDLIYMLITYRLDLKNIINRDVEVDESSTDLILVNAIGEYTRNLNEVKAVFEKTKYYKSKGISSSRKKHKDKWDGDYGYNTVAMCNPIIELLDIKQINTNNDLSWKQITKAGIKHGVTKAYYYRHSKIDWDAVQLSPQEEIDGLYEILKLRRQRLNVKEFLEEKLKKKITKIHQVNVQRLNYWTEVVKDLERSYERDFDEFCNLVIKVNDGMIKFIYEHRVLLNNPKDVDYTKITDIDLGSPEYMKNKILKFKSHIIELRDLIR